MRREKDKRLAGERDDLLDPPLAAERRRARPRLKALNDTRDDQHEARVCLIQELIPASGRDIWIEPPCDGDDGSHMTLGDQVFFNVNCVVLDVVPVRSPEACRLSPSQHAHVKRSLTAERN